MTDKNTHTYDASDIQVLEGLEPVRLRPGMYIGGTDEKAWHHLPIEIMDNSIDEAVAGFAKKITVNLIDSKTIEITDDGRGIPVDEHPKYPGKSALEVILTTLHSGGKFNNNVYKNWADKYLNERLDYNNSNIGTLGYAVYLQTTEGLQYLTHTPNTSYTYNGYIDTSATFVVKSQYTIFTQNASSGAEITVLANSENTTTTTTQPTIEWEVELNTNECIDKTTYRANDSSQINVKVNGNIIDFSKYSVIDECYENTTNAKVTCSTLDDALNYTVTRKITYNNTTKNLTLNVSSTCN